LTAANIIISIAIMSAFYNKCIALVLTAAVASAASVNEPTTDQVVTTAGGDVLASQADNRVLGAVGELVGGVVGGALNAMMGEDTGPIGGASRCMKGLKKKTFFLAGDAASGDECYQQCAQYAWCATNKCAKFAIERIPPQKHHMHV
jgi:hypothetical protein